MFEQEIEMEKKSSSIGPTLVIAILVIGLLGGIGYVIWQSNRVLSAQDASAVIENSFKARGPVTMEFSTGLIGWTTVNEPHYAVLEKAGLVTIGKHDKEARKPVKLTAKGETEVASFPEFKPEVDKDRTTYHVPLATRKLVEVGKITMNGPNQAYVEYSWKWEPNKMGDIFDASGKEMQSLTSYQRASAIEKHGADYYHGAPQKAKVKLVNGSKGWTISND